MKLRDVTDKEVDSAVDSILAGGNPTSLVNEMMLDSTIKVQRRVNIKHAMLSSSYIRTDNSFEMLGAVSSTRERMVDVHNGKHYTTYQILFNGHVLAERRYVSDAEHMLGELIDSFNAHIGGPDEGEGSEEGR